MHIYLFNGRVADVAAVKTVNCRTKARYKNEAEGPPRHFSRLYRHRREKKSNRDYHKVESEHHQHVDAENVIEKCDQL
jgi:hypothetical protein